MTPIRTLFACLLLLASLIAPALCAGNTVVALGTHLLTPGMKVRELAR